MRGEYAGLERAVLEAVDVEADHVPDEETEDYDARRSDGTPIEIKTCQRWIADGGSRAGRRRGRWHVDPDAHDRLLGHGGIYLLVILEEDEIVASLLVDAVDLDAEIEKRATPAGGYKHDSRASIPWGAVIDPTRLEDPEAERLEVDVTGVPSPFILAVEGVLPFGVPEARRVE